MDDYISREAAIMVAMDYDGQGNAQDASQDIASGLVELPAADVRPVVYCKDCIHRPYSTEPGETSGFAVEAPDRECKCPCFNPDDGYYSWIPEDGFFCADGERRKEEP